ncbi:MAG: arnC 3 [Lacunisphaera sp.]|nr:arnC 3 [Lacunisphaera sp.]
MQAASTLTQQHLDKIRAFYEAAPTELNWTARSYRRLLAHYYNLLIPINATVLEIGCGSGELLSHLRAKRITGIDLSEKQIAAARARLPEATFQVQAGETLELTERFDYIIISDTLNLAADVQQLLERLHTVSHPQTRLVFNYYSSLWRPLLALAQFLGLRSAQPQSSWISTADVRNFLQLADWQPVFSQLRLLMPVRCLGLEIPLNRWLAPLLGWCCLTVFCVARPARPSISGNLTVSVVIPARNEAGNIEAAVLRTPLMGAGTELIFVEGHSRDAANRQGQGRCGPDWLCGGHG